MILVIKNRLLKNDAQKSVGSFLKILQPKNYFQRGGRHKIMFLCCFLDKVTCLPLKQTFWDIHPTENRFWALKSLEKFLWTSKYHFWEVNFWWPNPYFRWERKDFWIWVFLSVLQTTMWFWSSKIDFSKMVFRSPYDLSLMN